MTRVVVVDYGAGNLYSVVRALRHEGADVVVSADVDEVTTAERLVLPGVGAFGDAMRELGARNLVDPVKRFLETERPFLGICVGMQMMLGESTEFGVHPGLGLIPGQVVRITSPGLKVPHVGWNRIEPSQDGAWRGTSFASLESARPMVYFSHSFTAEPASDVHRLADATYGTTKISAAIRRGNAIGVQFHPEMSGGPGLSVLRGFLAQA